MDRVKTPIMPVLVPASDMRTCTYLSVDDDGLVIEGGAAIIEAIIGKELENKIKE